MLSRSVATPARKRQVNEGAAGTGKGAAFYSGLAELFLKNRATMFDEKRKLANVSACHSAGFR
jgi:hypothetical protein